jgi:membrane associated rhomboid family serine protease
MIPLRDSAPRYSAPFVTLGLIAVNLLVFFYELTLDPFSFEHFVRIHGIVPLQFAGFVAGRVPAGAALPPLIEHMFLHGGWLHVLGNMWFLWIFGDNVEDQLGHSRFLGFYLACGVIAAFLQIFLSLPSRVPSVGASGAIAGVMGAYLVLFPGARVLTLFPFFLILTFWIPAWVMLFYWIGMQLFSGLASLGAQASLEGQGGVAWWAHVGGFISGVVLVKTMGRRPGVRRYYEW